MTAIERPLEAEYEEQLAMTQRAARSFKEHLDALTGEFGKLDPEDRGLTPEMVVGVKKLQFMTAQYQHAVTLIRSMNAQTGAWMTQDFMSPPRADVLIVRSRFYADATHMLRVMEASFRNVVSVSPTAFSQAYRKWTDSIRENPKVCAAIAVAGAGVGGCLGAGLHGILGFPHGILHLGLHKILLANFGRVGGAIVGGVGGAVGSVVLMALLLGAVLLVDELRQASTMPDDMLQRREMERALRELQERSLDHETMVKMSNCYIKSYVRPVEAALNGKECLICLEEFGLDQRRVVVAPNCTGSHYVHERCSESWVRTRGDVRCVYCRQ